MSLLDLFRKKEDNTAENGLPQPAAVSAPVGGTVVPMAEIPDEAFAKGAVGFCCGIVPDNGVICAPLTGNVTQVADTYHALTLSGENGAQVILHVGIDTVALRGSGFEAAVRQGDTVRLGQKLMDANVEQIRSAGYPDLIILAVLNSDDYTSAELVASGHVETGDELIRLR